MNRFLRVCLTALFVVGTTIAAHAQANAPIASKQSALSTTVKTIKASNGTLQWLQCYNPNASVAYVQVFDTSGTVTLGTTVPKLSFGLSASGQSIIPVSASFLNAIKVAATTTAGGNTALGTALDCNFGFN